MPVPGQPRNPEGELPLRFRSRPHLSIELEGQSPGLQDTSLRGSVLALGTIRRLWRQTVAYVPAPPAFSWSGNSPAFSPGVRAAGWTRALRYMARSFYNPSNTDNTRFGARREIVTPGARQPRMTITAGAKRSRPTVRNRLTSFGSRVTPLNSNLPASEGGS
jgi:hypothetical protein